LCGLLAHGWLLRRSQQASDERRLHGGHPPHQGVVRPLSKDGIPASQIQEMLHVLQMREFVGRDITGVSVWP
jgi:hypothetical protein